MSKTNDSDSQLVEAIGKLKVHDHLCLIYETKAEQFATAVPFLRIGLERGEKCVYVADDNTVEKVRGMLRAGGIAVEAAESSGALTVFGKRDAYLRDGYFDPDRMIAFLKRTTDTALAEGYNALRLTGEMTWALGGDPGTERLMEYEAKLNEFFPDNPALAICQYNRSLFSAGTILGVIRTHPLVIYKEIVCSNAFFGPPQELLGGSADSREVDRQLGNMFSRQTDCERLGHAAETLRAQRDLVQRIADRSPACITVFDRVGRITFANNRAEEVLGLSKDEINQRTYNQPDWKTTSFDGSPFPDSQLPFEQVKHTLKPINDIRLAIERPNGRRMLLSVNAAPLMSEGGEFDGMVATFDDTTEKVKAQRERDSYTKKLEIFGHMVGDISSSLDTDEILARTTRNAVQLIGGDGGTIAIYDPEHQVMTYPYHFNMPESLALAIAKKGSGLAEQIMRSRETTVIQDYPDHPRALPEFVEAGVKVLVAAPIIFKDKPIGTLGVFGFTPGKHFAAADLKLLGAVAAQTGVAIENARLYMTSRDFSRNLQRKVAERTAALEHANEQLKELDRLKSMFIASTSHELRTPLNSIIGFSSLLLEDWPPELRPEQREDVEIVNKAGKHLLALINDVIDISKVEAGKLDTSVEGFNVKEVVEDALKAMEPIAVAKGLTLKAAVPDIHMLADKRRLLQVVTNLLSNALKFTERGSVEIRVVEAGDNVEISVIDTGVGISQANMAKLFKPFARLDSRMSILAGGTGLGLYLTKNIVEDVLNGHIEVDSEPEKGSKFTIHMPVRAEGVRREAA